MKALSLFSGIGGFDLALERLGVEVVAQVEIDPFARTVLERRFPGVRRLDDVRSINADTFDGHIDLVIGGFPCQDVSVAGRRGGLSASRSGLWWEMLRVIRELQPQWVVWENVPGLATGADDRTEFRSMCPCGWKSEWRWGDAEGEARGCPTCGRPLGEPTSRSVRAGWLGDVVGGLADIGYFGAWRLLDSRFFSVAQRRGRIYGCFARGGAGGERAREVLLEPQGMRRNPSPRRAKGKGPPEQAGVRAQGRGNEGIPDVAGPLGCPPKTGGAITDTERTTFVVPPITAKLAKGTGGPSGDEGGHLISVLVDLNSEDGTDEDGIADPITSVEGRTWTHEGDTFRLHNVVMSFASGCREGWAPQDMAISEDVSPTLDTCREVSVMAFETQQLTHRENRTTVEPGNPANAISASRPGSGCVAFVDAYACRGSSSPNQHPVSMSGLSDALDTTGPGGVLPQGAARVRRLTPKECERLQGFPDGWTCLCDAEGDTNRCTCALGPRYRVLGNAVTVTVVQWLLGRLVVEHGKREDPMGR